MTRSRPHDDAPPLALAGARIERLMSVVRWAASGLVFGIGPFIPNIGFDQVVALGAGLFVLSALVTILSRRLQDHAGRSIVSHVALAGDALAGMGAVIVFAPGPEWGATIAVGVILIGSGAFRGGAVGCIATLAATAVGYLAGEAIRFEGGARLEVTHIALTLVAYAFAAVVFTGWHREVRRVVADRAATAARLTLVGRAASDVIYEWDIATGTLTLSEATATQLGYDIGRTRLDRTWWEERLHPEDAGPVRDALATLLRSSPREWEMEYRFRKADGTFTTVHDHGYVQWSGGRKRRPVRMVGTLVNVDSVSLYDPVTSLAGRALFADRVERRAVRGAISGKAFTVLVVDIEQFRELSARVGQDRGDAVLVELARRLETHLDEGETIARVAHDQLAFLISASTPDDAIARAAQIRDGARIPFGEDGAIRLDVVAGAAILPHGGAPDLMRQALAALADAKRTRRRVAVYEPGGEKRWEERVRLRDDLAGALARRELLLHYQPIADARTGRCVALEALVRWDHPELGLMDAGGLLQIASDIDLGPEIDRWVLAEATRAVGQLRHLRPDLGLAVNVSVASLDERFPVRLRALLAAALLPGDALTIELPEDPALADGPAAAALLELRTLGIGIAVDDFGTGYASLVPAPKIPATELKIDRVFAGRVIGDEHAARIVRSAVGRAKELGLRVVGEGVEDAATIAQLRTLGADLVQGRGVASPMSIKAVTKWLSPLATETKAAPAASRPTVIDDLRPTTVGVLTESLQVEVVAADASPRVAATALAGVEADAFPAEPAQPFGPDPMGWVLPDVAAATALALEPIRSPIEPATVQIQPTPARIETDPRILALASLDPRLLVLAELGRSDDRRGLRRGSEHEPADRLDERLVLLREHALREALGSVAG